MHFVSATISIYPKYIVYISWVWSYLHQIKAGFFPYTCNCTYIMFISVFGDEDVEILVNYFSDAL